MVFLAVMLQPPGQGFVLAQHPGDAREQFLPGERLGDIVVRAQHHAFALVDPRIARSEENKRDAGQTGLFPELLQHPEAVQPRHLNIAEDDIGFQLFRQVQPADAIRGGVDRMSRRFEVSLNPGPPTGVILDNEDVQRAYGGRLHLRGLCVVNHDTIGPALARGD